jgi:hypothetical protein
MYYGTLNYIFAPFKKTIEQENHKITYVYLALIFCTTIYDIECKDIYYQL